MAKAKKSKKKPIGAKKDKGEGEKAPEVMRFYVCGDTAEAVEAELTEKVGTYRTKHGMELAGTPEKVYEVLFFKGENPGKANLQAQGPSVEAAVQAAADEYGIDPAKLNKHFRIIAEYPLSKKDQQVAKTIPRPSAGGISYQAETLENIV
jgi:hypothetical protein